MATYECVNDYGVDPGVDMISQSAQWAVCVFRFRYPATYSRLLQGSFTTNYPPAVEIRGNPLIITDDCIQLQVSQQKSQYTMQLAAVLAPGRNYVTEVFPGDWVMAWMFTNDEDAQSLLGRLRSVTSQGGVPLNGFRDGLKFVGRVSAIRKALDQSADGHRQIRYNLTGVGFQEMDSQIYYDPQLADEVKALGLLWGRLDADINKFISTNQQGIDINKALPGILDLMLGQGLPSNLKHGDSAPQLRSTTGLETHLADASDPTSTFSYAIPTVIAQCLGVQGTTPRGITRYADILETTIGIQSYGLAAGGGVQSSGPQAVTRQGPNADKAIATNFMPSNLIGTSTRRQCSTPLLGTMLPQAPQFTNTPVWALLQQFLNPAINEMFMCLRVNQDGNVMPTMIVRQFPFTTDKFLVGEADGGQPVTRYLTLPTWGIDPVMVNHVDVGRSDALRFNFVHVYGNAGSPIFDKQQIINNPPIRDDIDIARSGLRPYMSTVPCHVSSVVNHDAGKWMAVLSDFLMGQHMTLTGTLNCIGIQAPVVVGDNLEWDGDIYHIESIQHSCGIGMDGHKSFTTGFSLSHGLRKKRLVDGGDSPDTGIYADVLTTDQTALDPGFTVDTPDQPEADDSIRPGNVSTEAIDS